MSTPISITLYGDDDEEEQVYERKIVPWGMVKTAIRLSERMEFLKKPKEPEEELPTGFAGWVARFKRWLFRNEKPISNDERIMDEISQFIVDFFNNKFTVQQLEDGAESGEILSTMTAIISRARTMDPTVRQKFPTPKANRR